MANSNRYWYRLGLLFLVLVPLAPEIFIFALAGFAKFKGYQSNTCFAGSSELGDLIDTAVKLGAGWPVEQVMSSYKWFVILYGAFAGWIVACYLLIYSGWSLALSRLALGFAVTTFFILAPFRAPGWALASIADKNSCDPVRGPCWIFGKEITQAYATVFLGEPILQFPGALLTIAAFCVFAISVGLHKIVAVKSRSAS